MLGGSRRQRATLMWLSNLRETAKSLFDLVRVEDELTRLFERKVDLGVFSSLNPYIIDDVKKEMKILYEKR